MEKDILERANHCLNCPTAPCKSGCPLGNNIPKFINCIKQQNYESAYNILTKTTLLSYTCGNVCPHTKQCQGKCVRGIKGKPVSIGELEQQVALYAISNNLPIEKLKSSNGKRVAVVGGGPAGLTCAGFLALNGTDVTIYEKQEKLGGILRYGIPDFRLNKEILQSEIARIINFGITVKTNQTLGKDFTLQELTNNYDAVFLAVGANCGKKLGIAGENNKRVLLANNLLESGEFPNLQNKSAVVIGGGNVAIDCARTLKHKSCQQVTLVYRRSRAEMPAEAKEIEMAESENIDFNFLTTPKNIVENANNLTLHCTKNKLVEVEGTRPAPVEIEGSEFTINAGYIFLATGAEVNPELKNSLNLNFNKWGYLEVNENYQTSNPKIFAGGDLTNTIATVANACRSGRNASEKILEFLK